MMQRRPLGRTGTDVTILGYGAMELSGLPREPVISDEEAGRLLNAVLDDGINLITTAAGTGAGILLRGGTARGGPAADKAWRQGPLGMPAGEGQRRWESSGIEDLLGEVPRLEFMLRFTLSHPALSSAIVGTSNRAHLRANVAIAGKGPLPAGLYEAARARLASAVPS